MSAPGDRLPVEPAEAAPARKDFQRLRQAGEKSGASLAIGAGIGRARDAVARAAIVAGLTPNRVTVLGFLVTCVAGWCLLKGASHQVPYFYNGAGPKSWWPAWAAMLLVLAGACDMLDGAIARLGNMSSKFGAILDSTLDRFSDMAIFLACALHFAMVAEVNLTLMVLAVVALGNSFLISYVKARAEEIIEDCSVGYWLRGERFAAVLIGCATGHVTAVLWQFGVLNFLTVWRRLDYARRTLASQERAGPPPPVGPEPGLLGHFQPWRHPRGSIPYDVVTGVNIAWIVAAPWIWGALAGHGPHADPLRLWFGT
jgi:CDP-diacylglycerol--glycerol-3-phosphate 3-phosphatidyltransferase